MKNYMAEERGVTLIELMIGIAIAAILVSVGVPSFKQLMINNEITQTRDNLYTTVISARSEAIRRGKDITLARSGTTWAAGWSLFIDTDKDGTVDTGEEILKVGQANTNVMSISWSGTQNYVRFNSQGLLTASSLAGTFTLCHSQGGAAYAKSVNISTTGRPMMASKKEDGSALTCS